MVQHQSFHRSFFDAQFFSYACEEEETPGLPECSLFIEPFLEGTSKLEVKMPNEGTREIWLTKAS